MEVPQKTKSRLTFDPAIPLSDVYMKEYKPICRRYLYTDVYCSFLHRTKLWNQIECPKNDEWAKACGTGNHHVE
jgi:hypothetical protein